MDNVRTCGTCSKPETEVTILSGRKSCESCLAKMREWQRASRERHPGKHRDRVRQARAKEPHKTFHMTSRYHAGLAGVPSDLTVEDALDIYNTPNVCAYCGIDHGPTPGKRMIHVDHIIPMVQGGHNTRWNLTKVCNGCNSSKGSASLLDFRNRTPEFTQERFDAVVAGMAERSGLALETILRLLDQSNAFERAIKRERGRLSALLAEEIAGATVSAA